MPDGDFCSDLSDATDPTLPKLPNCADSVEANADALTVDINDGEGTECTIDLQSSPGTQNTVYWADRISKGIFSSFCGTEDGQNPNCLNAITTYSQKTETWLVFVVHGLSSNGNVEWVINLGESIRGR